MRWFDNASIPVRDDYAQAQHDTYQDLAQPGVWWTGAERVEIARVARNALHDADPLAPWVAPSTVEGRLADVGIPEAAADAAYRLARSPGTVTNDWYMGIVDRGVSELAYVELVTVVVRVAAVEAFARAAGIEAPPLPEPQAGEPTRAAHPGAKVDRHWVPTIDPADAAADLPWLYDGADQPANVQRALSGAPEQMLAIRSLQFAGYLSFSEVTDFSTADKDHISRPQVELVAATTSQVNECFY